MDSHVMIVFWMIIAFLLPSVFSIVIDEVGILIGVEGNRNGHYLIVTLFAFATSYGFSCWRQRARRRRDFAFNPENSEGFEGSEVYFFLGTFIGLSLCIHSQLPSLLQGRFF